MFINSYTDDKGDLFAKFFLIDSSLNDRKWATTDEANERYARTAIGTPFTVMHDKDESLFKDYHPFLKGDAPVKDQIDFAYKYAIGQIVDVTKESGRYKAAGGPVVDNPWFAIVKITDPTAKEELSKPDSKLMPQAVSPGIIHYEGPDNAISSYHIVHLAAVDRGAYGPRAIKWASCSGDAIGCIPTLKAASYKERNHICPLQVLSSYAQKSGSSDINTMSAVNNANTPGPQTFGTGTISTSYPDQQQSQTPTKPTIRIRKQKPLGLESEENEEEKEGGEGQPPQDNPNPNENQNQNQNPQASVASVTKELAQLKKQYESQANVWKQDSMRRELQDAIPKALFTDPKGRFRQKDWEKEVDARLQQGLPIETIREIYQLKVQMLEVPEIAIKKRASSIVGIALPKGAGASLNSQYDAEDEEKRMKLNDLGRIIRGQY